MNSQSYYEPTKERCRHNGGIVTEKFLDRNKKIKVRHRAAWECPLDVYYDLGVLGEDEYQIGMHFSKAYHNVIREHGFNTIKPVSAYDAEKEPSESERLIDMAYKTLPSAELRHVIEVCGFRKSAFSPEAREKLYKGLGKLACNWHEMAVEICDPPRKEDEP